MQKRLKNTGLGDLSVTILPGPRVRLIRPCLRATEEFFTGNGQVIWKLSTFDKLSLLTKTNNK